MLLDKRTITSTSPIDQAITHYHRSQMHKAKRMGARDGDRMWSPFLVSRNNSESFKSSDTTFRGTAVDAYMGRRLRTKGVMVE